MKRIFVNLHLFVVLCCILILGPVPIKAQTSVQEVEAMNADFMKRARPILEKLALKNKLGYGSSCSYTEETKRTDIGKRTVDLVSSITIGNIDLKPFLENVLSLLTENSELQGDLCNANKLLQCNSTGQCDCADAGPQGINLKLVREKDSCSIPGGSLCASEEILNKKNPLLEGLPQARYQCSANRRCVVKRTGKSCSEDNLKAEFAKVIKEENVQVDSTLITKFILKKINEGICVCKGATSSISILLILVSSTFGLLRSYL